MYARLVTIRYYYDIIHSLIEYIETVHGKVKFKCNKSTPAKYILLCIKIWKLHRFRIFYENFGYNKGHKQNGLAADTQSILIKMATTTEKETGTIS